MTPERWKRVEDLYDAALGLTPAERTPFLERSCADDEHVRAEVESLLRMDAAASGFLEQPAFNIGLPAALVEAEAGRGKGALAGSSIGDPLIGEEIGAYRVVSRLGTGGMGVVYLAEQRNPARVVALKVIRPGIASESVLRRFEHEAQMLGRLNHPGIARIFEAGAAQTPLGVQPFFAMEYIVGEPLAAFAERRALGVRERLQLLIRICDAVHHAHSKGVIHRDLKPANILVEEAPTREDTLATEGRSSSRWTDAIGQPRILDFGVGRVADAGEATLRTEAGQIVGTLAYMSPEQVSPSRASHGSGGQDQVDTRSDVYSLGVLSYQLLTGSLPHDVSDMSLLEAARTICDEAPLKPGARDRALRGDLETVLLKALEKEPGRRYQSAAALAEDMQRVLLGQPILARPATTTYHLRKLVQRHKLPFAALASVFLLVVAFAIWMSVMYARAEKLRVQAEEAWREQQEATARAEAAQQLADRRAETEKRVTNVVTDAFRALNPSDSVSRDVNARDIIAREIVDRGIRKIEAELSGEPVARGRLQYQLALTCSGLGLYDRAVELLKQAIQTRRAHDEKPSLEMASYLSALGMDLVVMGRNQEAKDAQLEALQIYRRELPEHSPRVAGALTRLALTYAGEGEYEEAERLYLESAALHKQTPGHEQVVVAQALNNLAGVLAGRGDYERAEEVLLWCVKHTTNTSETPDPMQASLAHNLGWVLCMQGRHEEAEEQIRSAIAVRQKVYPEGHERTTSDMLTLGLIMTRTGRATEGEPLIRRCIDIRQTVTPDHVTALAEARSALGECLMELGNMADAEPLMLQATQAIRSVEPTTTETSQLAMARLVRLYDRTNRPDQAAHYRAMLRPRWDVPLPDAAGAQSPRP